MPLRNYYLSIREKRKITGFGLNIDVAAAGVCGRVWVVCGCGGCQGRVEKATVKGATGNGRNRGRVDEPGYKSSRVGGRDGECSDEAN